MSESSVVKIETLVFLRATALNATDVVPGSAASLTPFDNKLLVSEIETQN
jgi:hypothetical protein